MKILDDYPLEVIPKNVTNGDILKTMFPNDLWLHIYARRAKKNGGTHHIQIEKRKERHNDKYGMACIK